VSNDDPQNIRHHRRVHLDRASDEELRNILEALHGWSAAVSKGIARIRRLLGSPPEQHQHRSEQRSACRRRVS